MVEHMTEFSVPSDANRKEKSGEFGEAYPDCHCEESAIRRTTKQSFMSVW